MSRMQRFFSVLGLKMTAKVTAADVKTAYRRCAMECHPDLFPDALKVEKKERFQVLQDAFEHVMHSLQKGDAEAASSSRADDDGAWRQKYRASGEECLRDIFQAANDASSRSVKESVRRDYLDLRDLWSKGNMDDFDRAADRHFLFTVEWWTAYPEAGEPDHDAMMLHIKALKASSHAAWKKSNSEVCRSICAQVKAMMRTSGFDKAVDLAVVLKEEHFAMSFSFLVDHADDEVLPAIKEADDRDSARIRARTKLRMQGYFDSVMLMWRIEDIEGINRLANQMMRHERNELLKMLPDEVLRCLRFTNA